jgi:hypothetical protein
MDRAGLLFISRKAQLGDDHFSVRDENPHAPLDPAYIGAQVVLEVLDAHALDGFHQNIVATSSYFVKGCDSRKTALHLIFRTLFPDMSLRANRRQTASTREIPDSPGDTTIP